MIHFQYFISQYLTCLSFETIRIVTIFSFELLETNWMALVSKEPVNKAEFNHVLQKRARKANTCSDSYITDTSIAADMDIMHLRLPSSLKTPAHSWLIYKPYLSHAANWALSLIPDYVRGPSHWIFVQVSAPNGRILKDTLSGLFGYITRSRWIEFEIWPLKWH